MIDTSSGVRAEVVRLPGADAPGLWLLRAEGTIETAGHPLFARVLEAPCGCGSVAVDLSLVQVLSAAGAGGLRQCAQRLTDSGRRLFLAAAGPAVADVLKLTTAGDAVTLLPSVREVLTACTPPAPAAAAPQTRTSTTEGRAREDPSLEQLRAQLRDLRGKIRSHPLIAQAQGMLLERYRLPGPSAAFDLLRDTSQRHNVKLRTLAGAILTAPRPGDGARMWFPGRTHAPAPALDFLPGAHADRINRSTVIAALLDRAMEVTDTHMGNVQLVDPATGGLRMEQHAGLSEEFVDHFDLVTQDGTCCALAAKYVSRVTVTDVATDPVFDERSRAVILGAGCRAAHSTPLTTGSGRCLGMVSTHLSRPGPALSAAQARVLDEIGGQAGSWLAWYRRTVVLDALEYLHHRAVGAPR